MAKSQKHGNREAKKPKQVKLPTSVVAAGPLATGASVAKSNKRPG
jgi:hypothetical protein